MKRGFLAVLLLLAANLCVFAQKAVTLDEAISTAAKEIGGKLEKGIKIAVLNFTSTSPDMSEYVIDEVNNALVNDGRLTVVDRQNLDLIRKELGFNDSEEVSNKSAQQIGRMLGAQLIVNGSMGMVRGSYRLRMQVLEVETAIIKYSSSTDIANDQLVKSLMENTGSANASKAGSSSGSRSRPNSSPVFTGDDFTPGQRAGAVALNLLFGAGSAWQKDRTGAAWTGVLEGIGVAVIIGAGVLKSIEDDDYKRQMDNYVSNNSSSSYYGGSYNSKMPEEDHTLSGLMTTGGWLFYGTGFLIGTIRAITFHNPDSYAAVSDPLNITLVSDQRGNTGLQLSYTFKY